MLNIEQFTKLTEEWFKSVPEDMKDKVITASFSIEPISFTPRQILSKVKAAARKSKTRADFLKESGLCAEFLETLEIMYKRRMKMEKKRRVKE